MVEYVIEGSYSVRAEAPITVVRANGAKEAIPAGTEVTLAPGDALISRNETVVEAWNSGTVPTVLLNWMFINGASGHFVPGWIHGIADVEERVTLPRVPATVTLLRVTMPNGGELTIEKPDGMQHGVEVVHQGRYPISRIDGTISIDADLGSPFVGYVLRVEPDSTAGALANGSPSVSPIP